METRKKLSDVQFNALLEAQLRHDKQAEIFTRAKENLELVSRLIFDSHGLIPGTNISVDLGSREIIVTE